MDGLQLALGFVEDFCADRGVASGDVLRLVLVIEELFTNTIVHGYGGGHDAPVHIEIGIDPDCLSVRFEEQAPAFDPLKYLDERAPDLDAAADQRGVGGLGLPLVAEMAERFDYEHVAGVNRLCVVLRRGA